MRKSAKVYEAGESVEGAKPKVVYESHKKCTPCEFGAQVKAATIRASDLKPLSPSDLSLGVSRVLRAMPYDASVLGTAGAGVGALMAGKGKRLRGAGRGAARGVGAGVGGNLGAAAGVLAGAGLGGLVPAGDNQTLIRGLMALTGGGLGMAGGLYGGYQAGGAVADAMQGKDKTEDEQAKEKTSAFTPTQAVPHYTNAQLLLAPLLGAGIGGAGGALLSNKKTRLRNALLGAAGGGLVGGGAALGYKLTNTPSARMLQHQKDLEASTEPKIKNFENYAAEARTLHDAVKGLSPVEEARYADLTNNFQQTARDLRAEPGTRYQNLAHHRGQITGVGAGLAAVPFGMAIAGLGDEADARKKKKEKKAFEKAAIPAFGGRNYSLAPRGAGIGLNAGYDYLGGVVPAPYVGVDIGTPHTGMMLSGPIPGIGLRSGMFSRAPGATSRHNNTNTFGHRSLYKYLFDEYSGRDPEDVEDDVHNDRLQSMRNVTKDEFYEAIPDYHEGPKGKPLTKEFRKALAEYYHANSRPKKEAAVSLLDKIQRAGSRGAELIGYASKRQSNLPGLKLMGQASDAMTKKSVAYEFGSKVAFKIDLNALKMPAMGGAALGAVAGGVHGLINPGEDERGNRRNRFGAMLRGALGGGAVGGLGGAAMGQFAPDMAKNIYNFGRRTLTGKNQA